MTRWMRIVSSILLLGIIAGGVVAIILWSQYPGRFPILAIEVQDELKRVTESDIAEACQTHLDKGFFWVDIEGVQQSITRLPWVASASVRRVWPARILVSIQEQVPQARFGEEGVLNTEGLIFFPDKSTIPGQLPRFNGPKERAKEMLQQYHAVLEKLGPIGLSVVELNLAPNGTWQMRLNNGIAIILGKAELNERLTKFVLAYQVKLQTLISKIAYVDLRYTNGLAIGWKTGV